MKTVAQHEIDNFLELEKSSRLLDEKGLIEKENQSEISDLKTNYERLIEKYCLSGDSILGNFAAQISLENETAEIKRARQLAEIKEKLRKKKLGLLSALEKDEIDQMKSRIAAEEELSQNSGTNFMTKYNKNPINI